MSCLCCHILVSANIYDNTNSNEYQVNCHTLSKKAIQSLPTKISLTQYLLLVHSDRLMCCIFPAESLSKLFSKLFLPGKGAEATKGIMTDHLAELFSNPHSIPLPLWGENNFTLLARASLSNQHVRLFFLFHDRQNIKDSLDCLKYTCSFESLGLHWRR